jgi:hypothetical protein
MKRKPRTHCGQGHEMTPANTYRPPSQPSGTCRQCMRIRNSARRKVDTADSPRPKRVRHTSTPMSVPEAEAWLRARGQIP